jgi:hypothetical protein
MGRIPPFMLFFSFGNTTQLVKVLSLFYFVKPHLAMVNFLMQTNQKIDLGQSYVCLSQSQNLFESFFFL